MIQKCRQLKGYSYFDRKKKDKHTGRDREVGRQMDRQTDRQKNRQADEPTDRQTDSERNATSKNDEVESTYCSAVVVLSLVGSMFYITMASRQPHQLASLIVKLVFNLRLSNLCRDSANAALG